MLIVALVSMMMVVAVAVDTSGGCMKWHRLRFIIICCYCGFCRFCRSDSNTRGVVASVNALIGVAPS